MKKKDKQIVLALIVFFFFVGSIIWVFGFKNGDSIAIQLSRPSGATGWSTSDTQMTLTTFSVCIFGGLWIFFSQVLLIMYVARNYIFKVNDASKN